MHPLDSNMIWRMIKGFPRLLHAPECVALVDTNSHLGIRIHELGFRLHRERIMCFEPMRFQNPIALGLERPRDRKRAFFIVVLSEVRVPEMRVNNRVSSNVRLRIGIC